ncbi:MAG: 2-oxoglutarate dehydrogenase complex dihydrolipoyllysine-residue succinyltransferase [Rhodospirillales bacterium]
MTVEIKVPTLGESVSEATVAKWFKQPGEAVAKDEAVCELETDKVTIEVNSPEAGALKEIVAAEGSDVGVGAVLAILDAGVEGAAASPPPAAEEKKEEAPKEAPKQEAPAASPPPPPPPAAAPAAAPAQASRPPLSPAVRKLVDDNELDPSLIKGTGPDGRLTKGDVMDAISAGSAKRRAAPAAGAVQSSQGFTPSSELPPRPDDPREERVKMTKLRKVIAGRLKQAQNTAAMLTTWNEVDMGAAMDLRSEYKDSFEKKHGVRLGFMSFFVRAACIALKEWPAINAEIYGEELIYKNYYNVGVAVGTPQGLVVPVLKNADEMRFAEIEGTISDFGRRARDGKLGMDEMMGGTFTISNGGVFGSLNSMPILNVPQSAILGMHKIQKRPMAVGDKIEIRPMMYLALSYDHRIVDGREAVSFLVRMKDLIEDPQRIMLDV